MGFGYPPPCERIRLRWNVTNTGDAPSGPFVVKLLVEGRLVGVYAIPGLQAWERTSLSETFRVPGSDMYRMGLIVDPDDQVVEVSEANNRVEFGIGC